MTSADLHGARTDYDRYWEQFWRAQPRTYETAASGERDRVDALVSLLPDDVGAILDVGCGDGFVANRLVALGYDVCGVDIAEEALHSVQAPVRRGSADAVPAADGEFDCALACDVLEHLPFGSFESALTELARVARRYLVVNSPYRERLAIAQIRCGRCESAFHSSRHVRSIDPQELEQWFPGFRLASVALCGARVRRRRGWLQRAGQLVANAWYEAPAAVCPNCGYPVEPVRARQSLRLAFIAAHRLIATVTKAEPTEFVALLVRRRD